VLPATLKALHISEDWESRHTLVNAPPGLTIKLDDDYVFRLLEEVGFGSDSDTNSD
jgi:hypothetical protein